MANGSNGDGRFNVYGPGYGDRAQTIANKLKMKRNPFIKSAIDYLYHRLVDPNADGGPLMLHLKPNEKGNHLGLHDIVAPANDHDISDRLRDAGDVTLIFNDMKNWLPGPKREGRHLEALHARLAAGKRTHIFLLHPDTAYLHEVARTSGKTPQEQIDEIERAVRRICRGRIDQALPKGVIFEKRPLRITGHPFYNTYTLMKFDDVAYVNYYPIAVRGSAEVGNFHIYRPVGQFHGVYERIERDLSALQSKAEEAFPYDGYDLVKYYNDRGKIPAQLESA